jgi:hypothetical protein
MRELDVHLRLEVACAAGKHGLLDRAELAPGCLLLCASRVIGRHPRDCGAGACVQPEFMPKQNSALVGTTAGRSNDAPRREIGDEHVDRSRTDRQKTLDAGSHESGPQLVIARVPPDRMILHISGTNAGMSAAKNTPNTHTQRRTNRPGARMPSRRIPGKKRS